MEFFNKINGGLEKEDENVNQNDHLKRIRCRDKNDQNKLQS